MTAIFHIPCSTSKMVRLAEVSCLTILLLVAACANAQPGPPNNVITSVFGGDYYDILVSVQETSDGNAIALGHTSSFGAGQIDLYLVKIAPDGSVIWSHTYGGELWEEAYQVIETQDGGFFLVGTSSSFSMDATNFNIYVVRTDANGDTLWTRALGDVYREYGTSVLEAADGDLYVAGFKTIDPAEERKADMMLLRLDSDGNMVWDEQFKLYGGSENDFCMSMAEMQNGDLILAGSTFSPPSENRDAYIVRVNQDGELLSQSILNRVEVNYVNSVKATDDGGFVLCGTIFPDENSEAGELYLVRFDEDGNEIWDRSYGGDNWIEGQSVTPTDDGGFLGVGFCRSYQHGQGDGFLVRTDSEGDTLWTMLYGGDGWENLMDVRQFSDESVVAVGKTSSFGAALSDFYYLRIPSPSDLVLELISPQPGDTCRSLDTTLVWSSHPSVPLDRALYDVWLDTIFQLEDQSLVAVDTNDTTWSASNLLDDKTYYWKVRVTDTAAQDSATSGTWSFQTYRPDPPGAFAVVSPAEGDSVIGLTAELSWLESIDPDPGDVVDYIIQWADNPGFESFISDTTGETSYLLAPGEGLLGQHGNSHGLSEWSAKKSGATLRINSGGDETAGSLNSVDDILNIYWRVKAADSFGLETWADGDSTGRHFTIRLPDPPTPFLLAEPDSGAVIHDDTVSVAWNRAVDPNDGDTLIYTVQWTASPGFAEFASGRTTDTTFTIGSLGEMTLWFGSQYGELDELPDSTTIFWRVKAENEFNQLTWANEDTSGWSFRILLPQPPVEFPMLEPADGDTVQGDSITLHWSRAGDTDSADSVHYEIQWTTDQAFSFYLSAVTGDTLYTIEDLPEPPAGAKGETAGGSEGTISLFGDRLDELADSVVVYWRVRAIDSFGLATWANGDSTGWSFLFILTSDEPSSPIPPGIPSEYLVWGIYPNPFNPELNLNLNVGVGLPHRAHVRIRVYNLLGRLVAELADDDFPQGYRIFTFNGRGMASGLYFVHVEIPGRINTVKKIVLLR